MLCRVNMLLGSCSSKNIQFNNFSRPRAKSAATVTSRASDFRESNSNAESTLAGERGCGGTPGLRVADGSL